MDGADLIELTAAATDLGITGIGGPGPTRQPGAVASRPGDPLPAASVTAAIVDRGVTIDLTDGDAAIHRLPEQLERYAAETLAAHAAVVLAKTQATAARATSEAVARELDTATKELQAAATVLENERTELQMAADQLQQVRDLNAQLEQQRAQAEARAEEMRSQLSYEQTQRATLAHQIEQLERERLRLYSNLGWRARRRLRQASTQ